MSIILNSQMVSSGNDIYHTPEFYAYVRSHERLLKAQSVKAPVDAGAAHTFEYNFISLLIEMQLSIEDLAFFMVCNDLTCPTQTTRDFRELVMPPAEVVAQLKTLYRQKQGRV